jgi:hypothetical protein
MERIQPGVVHPVMRVAEASQIIGAVVARIVVKVRDCETSSQL